MSHNFSVTCHSVSSRNGLIYMSSSDQHIVQLLCSTLSVADAFSKNACCNYCSTQTGSADLETLNPICVKAPESAPAVFVSAEKCLREPTVSMGFASTACLDRDCFTKTSTKQGTGSIFLGHNPRPSLISLSPNGGLVLGVAVVVKQFSAWYYVLAGKNAHAVIAIHHEDLCSAVWVGAA